MSELKGSKHLYIPFKDIEVATKNFEECIGKGGYGWVYKGQLLVSGKSTTVAVKRLNANLGQGLKEFLTEIQLLADKTHPNLITLLGYCDEGKEKIIVYEYAKNGSLDRHIRRSTLTWLERLKICLDAARGLKFLHNRFGKDESIIHRDIKSANILIDQNWVAKISDLGLSKLSVAATEVSYYCGTLGYLDPEYLRTLTVKKESDVFSFGMVLFEVLCGRLCGDKDHHHDGLPFSPKLVKDYYQKNKLDEIVDPVLRNQTSSETLEKFSVIAYRCLLDDREQRPPMNLVVKKLEELFKIQVVHFRSLEKPKDHEFSLELSNLHNYDDVVEHLARHLNLDDPSKIRLTSSNYRYPREPKPQPVKYRGVEHLSDMLKDHDEISDILYYEILDIPLPELQCLKTLNVAFRHATKDEVGSERLFVYILIKPLRGNSKVVTHTITLQKQRTVQDLVNELKTKVELSDRDAELRLLSVFYNKIIRVLLLNEEIEYLGTIRAEEVPEEEKKLGPQDHVIQVIHFMIDSPISRYILVHYFGEPFLLTISEGETLAEVKVRIQKKLQVPDEEFSKWRFAFLSSGVHKSLQESDVVSSHFQRRRDDDEGCFEEYLALEHDDSSPNNSLTKLGARLRLDDW